VSMSLVLRGAKKLRVIVVLVGSLPTVDFGADTVDQVEKCFNNVFVSVTVGTCY
jgi:hypothetical protein